MGHQHEIIDHDKHFIIDPVTRKITPARPEKNNLVQYDHNSERYTFEIPRYVEGHDMSLCNVIQFHYLNVSADNQYHVPGIDESHDIGLIEGDEEKVMFTWLISRNATQLSGSLNFAIRFACVEGDQVDYDWHTEIHTGIIVSNGIDNGPIIVEEWRQKLFGTYEKVIDIVMPVSNWVRSKDATHYTQDLTIPDVTENTKIDLQPSPEQIITMISYGITMFVANDNGDVKAYSVSEKPPADMTIQATVKETKL